MAKFNYSLSETAYNAFCFLMTKIFYGNCRLIRRPFIVRGKKYIDFGQNLTTGRGCQFEVADIHANKCMTFGDNVNIGHYVRIQCVEKVSIGSNVLMGSRVTIIDHSHGSYRGKDCDEPDTAPNKRRLAASPISIGDNVWIGEGAVIQQGVTIGKGSIIAANSVVTKDIPAFSIAGGIPAVCIKRFNPDSKQWERIIEIKEA